MKRYAVLFLCTANSARSQMAEALLRAHGGDRFVAYSAGLELKDLNPLTVRVMQEIGIDVTGHYSKSLSMFLGKIPINYAIVVCDGAERACPKIWPFGAKMLYWPFDDPAQARGDELEQLKKFRAVRDEIQERIVEWIREIEAVEREEGA
jgi:arsenate reductase